MFGEFQTELPAPRAVVNYAGGKQKLLKHILPLIKPHVCYVEPFGGSLAVLLAKPQSQLEVVNDINGILVQFYRNVKSHHEALLDEMESVLNSRREFEDYGRQPGLTEIQKVARWFIRNKLSFAGQGKNFAISRSHALSSREKRLIAIKSLSRRLDNTTIEERSWELIFASYDTPETFFFLDPPYPEPGGTLYGGWDELATERFCAAVRKLKGQWVFTFKDNAQVREAMAGYSFRTLDRARGISNNAGKKKADRYQEIIITSDRVESASNRKGKSA
jgi:DNA adenine methylase